MAPDGAIFQRSATGFVAFTCVYEIHVVDVAIGLVEFAVAVAVITVPDVEAGQVLIDFIWCLAGRDLLSVPVVDRIFYEIPDGITTTGVIYIIVIITGVARGQGPVSNITVDGVTVG